MLLNDLEAELNRQAVDFSLTRFDRLSFIFTIMNPKVATPFPGGVIVRRSRRELDARVPVDFALWKGAGSAHRPALVLSNALDHLAGFVPGKVKAEEFALISAFLTSARFLNRGELPASRPSSHGETIAGPARLLKGGARRGAMARRATSADQPGPSGTLACMRLSFLRQHREGSMVEVIGAAMADARALDFATPVHAFMQ